MKRFITALVVAVLFILAILAIPSIAVFISWDICVLDISSWSSGERGFYLIWIIFVIGVSITYYFDK